MEIFGTVIHIDTIRVKFKVNVIGQSSLLQEENFPFSAMDTRYEVTHTFLITRRQHQTCTQHVAYAILFTGIQFIVTINSKY